MASAADYKSVHFNLKRLQEDNKGGYTQAELARSTFRAAKRNGTPIQQVRGRRVATERFNYATGEWEKV